MFRKIALASTTALGIALFGSVGASASAISPASPLPVFESTSDAVQTVANRKARVWKYNQRRNGNRYRARRGNYTHYHNGYYYSQPWWNLGSGFSASIGVPGVSSSGGNAHVQWCLDHYRSYSSSTDTYNGYDGNVHRCNSPYN